MKNWRNIMTLSRTVIGFKSPPVTRWPRVSIRRQVARSDCLELESVTGYIAKVAGNWRCLSNSALASVFEQVSLYGATPWAAMFVPGGSVACGFEAVGALAGAPT
jgi:hypothetical protein